MRCRSFAGAIVCGPRLRCATAGCRGEGTLLCDYPVTRRKRETTCNRRVCRACALAVSGSRDYCPPHARVHKATSSERAVLEEFFPGHGEKAQR